MSIASNTNNRLLLSFRNIAKTQLDQNLVTNITDTFSNWCLKKTDYRDGLQVGIG